MNISPEDRIPRHLVWLLVGLSVPFVLIWQMPSIPFLHGKMMPLWLHTSAETFSIIVDMLVFGVAWNAYSDERPGNVLIVAVGLLAVGLLDLAHVLSYRDMPDFVTSSGTEKGINFWLAARFVSVITMLTVALRSWQPFAHRHTRYWLLSGSLALTVVIYWLGLFHQDVWPRTFIEGKGLTPFKIGVEYVLSAILLLTAALFYQKVRSHQDSGITYLFAATVITILSELCFTLYANATDLFNLLGHVYKIVAYICIYHAVFVVSIREPYLKLGRAREELSFQKMLLNAQGEAAMDGILTVDAGGRILWYNRKFLDLWGTPPELLRSGIDGNVLADSVSKVVDAEAFKNKVRHLYEHHDETSRDEIQLKSGKVFDRYSAPVVGDDGVYLGRVWRFHDITEKKHAETELLRHRAHLEELVLERTSEAVDARKEAERANEAKSLFLANMSHELRTPMHAILSFSELGLEKTKESATPIAKLREYFDYIHQSGNRLLALLNDLLDLSKLEAGKMLLHTSPHDLRTLIQQVVGEISILASNKAIVLDTGAVPANLVVACDGARIGQVLNNLLSNAIKSSSPSGTIRISASPVDLPGRGEGDNLLAVLLRVEDEGCGIPEDDLENIFDKFVQSSKTRSGSGGTGLGLSICREIIELHGGTIYAENNPEGGASLIFTLPVEQPKAHKEIA